MSQGSKLINATKDKRPDETRKLADIYTYACVCVCVHTLVHDAKRQIVNVGIDALLKSIEQALEGLEVADRGNLSGSRGRVYPLYI